MEKAAAVIIVFGVFLALIGFSGWFDARYYEYAFERDCSKKYPEAMCEAAVKTYGARCEADSMRRRRGGMTLIPTIHEECLFAGVEALTRSAGVNEGRGSR